MAKKGANKVQQTLDTIAGDGGREIVFSSGEKVKVVVCNGRALPKMLQLVGKVAEDLGLQINEAEQIKEKLLDQLSNVGFILKLIANYAEDVYDLSADLSTLENADKVADLPLDDIAKLVVNIVEVNRAFFISRVLPVVMAGMRKGAL